MSRKMEENLDETDDHDTRKGLRRPDSGAQPTLVATDVGKKISCARSPCPSPGGLCRYFCKHLHLCHPKRALCRNKARTVTLPSRFVSSFSSHRMTTADAD